MHFDQTKTMYFRCSYNVIYTQPLDEIVHKFRQSGAGVLFGAQRVLPADQTTYVHLYPAAEGSKYLNAGLFIGYLSKVRELLSSTIRNTECDNQFMARAYLDESVRNRLSLMLDHRSTVFQNLNGAIGKANIPKLVQLETCRRIVISNGQIVA